MNTNVNNITFGANIKTLSRVKNKADLELIKKEFEKGTAKYPNDSLYITKYPQGAYSWHITDERRGEFYNGMEIFTNSLNDHLKEMSPKKLAKELINAFKALKLHQEVNSRVVQLEKDIEKTTGLCFGYAKIARTLQAAGKSAMAKRYEVLAVRGQEKLMALKNEYNSIVDKFDDSISRLSKDFPEVGQVELGN